MFAEDAPFAKSFMNIFTGFVDSIRSYGDCDVYAEKIARWDQRKYLTCWLTCAKPMKCGFNILGHGDFWLNNMMFKLNADKEPEDVLLLDFQGCSWSGPGLDLHYFITSSVHNDVKIDCYDELIKHYHEQLLESLKKLKYDQYVPTLDDLYQDLSEKAGMGKKISSF